MAQPRIVLASSTRNGERHLIGVRIERATTIMADYVLREDATGLVLGSLTRTYDRRGWLLSEAVNAMGEGAEMVILPTLFACAQVAGQNRIAYLRNADARRAANRLAFAQAV